MSKTKNGESDKPDKSDKLGKSAYYDLLAPLQHELNDVARWLQHTGKRLAVVIEGRYGRQGRCHFSPH